jgi:hypothetical protein
MPEKTYSRATLHTRAIGSSALPYATNADVAGSHKCIFRAKLTNI